jgi:hypothetical protein
MARYSLTTFWGTVEREFFDARTPQKLMSILDHPKHHRAGQKGPWDEEMKHPDRFVIKDSMREKLFDGGINECIAFVKKLK